jgi:hypothetical protein
MICRGVRNRIESIYLISIREVERDLHICGWDARYSRRLDILDLADFLPSAILIGAARSGARLSLRKPVLDHGVAARSAINFERDVSFDRGESRWISRHEVGFATTDGAICRI